MDESTPRGIIRGVLTTASVSRSARTSRPRKTPRGASAKKTPVNPPTHAEVATRLLTRSRSANKRKATPGVATPADSTTPRTLVSTAGDRASFTLLYFNSLAIQGTSIDRKTLNRSYFPHGRVTKAYIN